MSAVNEHGLCIRCRHSFGERERCVECGVHRSRIVRPMRRRRIGGKRGRNSGTTNKAKQK